jgi:pre-mRNA-splicing factor SPF27
MQKLAHDQSEKIEAVNRDRKYHQVIKNSCVHHMLYFSTILRFDEINMLHSLNYQQNTAYELSALSIQWKELCEKNMEIQAACSKIENQIEELKKEASER